MKLVKAKIVNYRSIENVDIDFEYNTKVFVGLSETGKSNLLKALYTLSNKNETTNRDIKEDIESDDNSNIEFLIKLDDEDKNEILNRINELCYNVDLNKILYNSDDKSVKFNFFLNRNYIYKVDIIKGKKYFQYYSIDEEKYAIKKEYILYTGDESCPLTMLSDNHVINNKCLICSSSSTDYSIEDTSKIKKVDINEINEFISNIVINYLKSKEWNVLFWKYEEKNILPSEINTINFINDTDLCVPLKKLFELYGISDIKKEYESRKKTTRANSFDNLLKKTSTYVTDYLRKKWKTMPKETKLLLQESGDNIRISIEDAENKYDMLDRSDGYKRLLSFLIMISIDNTNSNLKNAMLLIDCPEAEIDIPGQKYLRDELIEIGKNNYVFYSTHSPYMIDSDNIFRHYIVSKEKEVTTISMGEEANYSDSSLLFNALGTALFENVNNVNIAFEGWTDKQLFYSGQKKLNDSQKNKINKLGICHLGGLRNANSFAATWQLICKTKKYIIISDSDNVAIQGKKRFIEEHLNENTEWYTYSELVTTTKKIETAEDFVTSSRIKIICDKYIEGKDGYLPINVEKLDDDSKSNMSVIDDWLRQFEYDSEELKNERNKIKSAIFNKISKNDIIDEYKLVLEKILCL